MLLTRDPPQEKRTLYRLKMKVWKKNIPRKWTGKKPMVAILISDKIDFITRAIKRDPGGHFRILMRRIQKEDINTTNIHAPNIGTPKYIRKILEDFKKDIDSNTIIVGDFNTPVKNG